MVLSESDSRKTPSSESRKKWGQSPRIQTKKGKRRRKQQKPKRKGNKYVTTSYHR